MWLRERKRTRMARKQFFLDKNAQQWATLAKENLDMRKQIFKRAGEMICLYGGLEEDPIMYFRDDEAPTIVDYLDAVQVFIPAPITQGYNESKVLEHLANDKPKVVTVLAEVLEASSDTLREYCDVLIGMKLR